MRVPQAWKSGENSLQTCNGCNGCTARIFCLFVLSSEALSIYPGEALGLLEEIGSRLRADLLQGL